jgi:tetratricopeptide (TPR) repeat protein
LSSEDESFSHLNDLPKRDANSAIERAAQAAFEKFVSDSSDVFQQIDRKDFGTDYQLEVAHDGAATNVRLHVQLKGTAKAANKDGSVSVEIDRTNLNYLMQNAYSFFVCYHLPTNSLLYTSADSVVRRSLHADRDWTAQKTITVRFVTPLTQERLSSLVTVARLNAFASRDERFAQVTTPPENLPNVLARRRTQIHVPDDLNHAVEMLASLYRENREEDISCAFDRFASVLGSDHDAMTLCYFAEINLGMNGRCDRPERVRKGIQFLSKRLGNGRFGDGGLHYSIGNGHTALGDEGEAIAAYERALAHPDAADNDELRAQTFKNMGSSYSKIGEGDVAAGNYHLALDLNPDLPEAHHALGCHYYHLGDFQRALDHFDKVVFTNGRAEKTYSIAGWRVNIFFNLGNGGMAFREINALLPHAASEGWIWPWCAQQVSLFGNSSIEIGKLSLVFWDRFLKVNPGHAGAVRGRLLTRLYLRLNGQDVGASFAEFKAEFTPIIEAAEPESVAYLWDRLGHWAQEEDDWSEAESCFRKAYDLDGGDYGYCLGTALNFLGRGQESLPILLEQAEITQPDDLSWSQLARAYELVGDVKKCVRAYRKAIKLNRQNASAWFDLGGTYWNFGQAVEAARVWNKAVQLFPNNALATTVRREFGFLINTPDLLDETSI